MSSSTIQLQAEEALEQVSTPIAKAGTTVSSAIHNAIISNPATRTVADWLHGTWLGHPLHPVLTDFTIGAWTMASIFDAAGAITDSDELRRTGDHLTTAGTISALPTALTGLVEYSAIPQQAAGTATLHGLLNAVNLGFFVASIAARRRGNHARGAVYSSIGLAMTCVSAWLGGKLVYTERVGVDHSDAFDGPRQWTAVLDADDLPLRRPKRIDVDGKPVMLYRDGPEVYALGATCAHAGGPLDEGRFEGSCVQCPWHDSVYDMRNGKIVHGPTTHVQPAFEARIRDGKIELRLMHD